MMPMHHFSFFDSQDINERIRCKVLNDQNVCFEIESKKCRAKGVRTEGYEICMIALD